MIVDLDRLDLGSADVPGVAYGSPQSGAAVLGGRLDLVAAMTPYHSHDAHVAERYDQRGNHEDVHTGATRLELLDIVRSAGK